MDKGRVEAFSDGVIAIIITIMVLELKVPHGFGFKDLLPLAPVFAAYVLSFIYVGIYWNNHHHMLQLVHKVDGGVLWANLFLLFWLSMVPVTTAWMGENLLKPAPTALYGLVLLMDGIAYVVLQANLMRLEGPDSALARALGRGFKEKISPLLYLLGTIAAFLVPQLSLALYVAVAAIWIVPDRRVERQLGMTG
jgi:uncharacterized membrane protein